MKYLLLISCLFSIQLIAQDKDKWDVNNPSGPYKSFSFTVDEGTWMNLDVSPDGQSIAFDLLGDIYTMPINGGKATCIRSGLAMEVQPRFSPDGKQILFTSDAGGGDNIWTMNVDGSKARQITKENFRLLNNGVWTPDGQYIIARKHFTSHRSLGAGELWIYHTSGGDGLQLTPRKNDQQDLNEPSCSPDGRYIYYSEDMYPGGYFQYNKDPNNQIFVIHRYDREKGKSEQVTGGPGGAFRPQISHDGKKLAFIKRVRTKTVLYLRDLESGEEWPIYDQLSKDQQEAWTTFGVYTGFAWMPDDQSIVIWSQGKLCRISTQQIMPSVIIPFSCEVKNKVADVLRFQQSFDQKTFSPKVIRQATTSPDGKYIVFNAVGYLWQKKLPNGKPERITQHTDFEFEPAFSKDGRYLLFTTWNDTATGAIWKMDMQSQLPPVKLTKVKGIYRAPAFSPDGKTIVFRKDEGNEVMGYSYTVKPGVYLMNADGTDVKFVSENGSSPEFNHLGDRIYIQSGNNFASYKLDGSDEQTLFKSTYGSRFTVSPNGQWVGFVDLHQVYIAAFPAIGKPIDISAGATAVPVKKVSRDAGINLHWHADSKSLHYTLGDQYFTIPLEDRFEFIAGKPDSLFKEPESGISINLKVDADKPEGITVFKNARLITMKGNEVIENGSVIVTGNKISALGPDESINIPDGAKVIDCKGKTIMPGFIDAHAHGNHFRYGITPHKHWPYYVNLAYGVTTMHDPSANSEMVFAQSELVRSGAMVGPRVFSTGTILYGADGDFKAVINSIDDARSAIRRTNAYGAFSVKSYNQPRREQNQMVIQAARELKIEVVPEGGSFFYHNLGMIFDGHTTIEHNLPIATLYKDVINLCKQSKTAMTPTLIVCYGAPSGEYYWYQHTNVWEKEKLLRFTPRAIIDSRSRHRTMLPEEEYENGHISVSRSLKKLVDAGTLVNMGAHGQIQGIGAHWEIWMMQQGGMTNLEALKTATINPAISLGLDQSIGSLEVDKLADLIVLDQNPLDNIRNTESVHYTMINGRLFDTETMNEIGNHEKWRDQFFWELNKSSEAFKYHEETNGFESGHIDD
ncbi:MAG: PD40 domain-containing protein [Chitinophagaceae bacterium]|nr:PD40 domain-containing protein [Chitinophagaceae bacterium]